jgi:hypothetical protein
MIIVKIIVIIIAAALYWWGGYSWHNARRFILPLLLAGASCWFSHSFWAITMIVSSPILTIGYGDKSILKHIFGDAWARFVYLSLSALFLSAWMIFALHTNILLILGYIGLCGTLGITLRKINDLIGDFLFGIALALIVFIVR